MHKRRPTQQLTFKAQRLAGPAPQIEVITVLDDLAIAKAEVGLDMVDHLIARLAEGVSSHPARTPGMIIRRHALKGQGKALSLGAEHAPHITGSRTAQIGKNRVAELHILAVTAGHGLGIQLLEGLVETSDQLGVGVGHGANSGGERASSIVVKSPPRDWRKRHTCVNNRQTFIKPEHVMLKTVCSSLSMAMDAFVLANRLAEQRLFELQRVSLDGKAVDLGFAQIQVDGDLSLAEDAELILLAATGSAIDSTLSDNAALLPWLAQRAPTQQLASLCSSAFLLGAAGVLNGRRATTHWALASQFRQRFSLVNLQIEQLVCEDGQLLSSGGAHAGLDLCLHLIRQHAGDALAQQVANALVFDSQRGQQSRFAPLLPPPSSDCPLAPVLQWLHRHHGEAIDLNRLAAEANCSSRTLLRRFKASTGLTPNDYLQRVRISAAQRALRSQASLEQIAEQVGYADRATFAKLFKQLCGESPGAFRKRLRQAH